MTAKRTGGGTFDPDDRPIYFGAGNGVEHLHYALVAVNDIPGAEGERFLTGLLDAGHEVLLDSGIFWLTNEHMRAHGVSMDEALALPPEDIDGFEQLYQRYVDLVHRYGDRLWGYIELDQGGEANKRRTRARLEAEGLAPMPVYHPLNDGWAYFDEIARGYDRICFGNIVQANEATRLRLLHTMWERARDYPDLWVHVLGLTANQWCMSIAPDSCDSSSWLSLLRWQNAKTESALMRKIPVVEKFRYDLDNPTDPARGRDPALHMAVDAVNGINRVWRHALDQAGDAHPPRRDEEGPVAPAE